MITEQKNETNSKKADGAILKDGEVIGVIELKDHKTTDLARIEPQAFGYKNQHPKCRYVIISNFEKLRLYLDNTVEHREWNLFTLAKDDFRELYLCLAWLQVRDGVALKIKQESVSSEDQITKALYRDYSEFKRQLFADIVNRNPAPYSPPLLGEGSGVGSPNWRLLLFKKTQKLLDRLLFIFFAEDGGLLQPNSMVQIISQWQQLKELDAYVPLYDRIRQYFGYLDTGHQGKPFDVFAYNGGLFKPDAVLDALKIDDELLAEHTKRLSTYDFASDVDVNILGHIFENSLSEIEEITHQLESSPLPSREEHPHNTPSMEGAPQHTPLPLREEHSHNTPLPSREGPGVGQSNSAQSKRKQDGVFYTPPYITKYIVENTVGSLCQQKKQELGIVEADYFSDQRRQLSTKRRLLDQLEQYRQWLLQITILDPACGSGAFLNAALQWLMAEHRLIDEMQAKITGSDLVFQDVENSILEHNLFGVDINEESVEIAQLSLWLRTAKPNRKLNTLSQNIKCGNSLISDPAVAGSKAFNWQQEFPQVFERGGFDVVIGNPPYVQLQSMGEMSDVYAKCGFETYNKSADLYCLFTEQGYKLLKPGGMQSFIMPNKWMLVAYGKELRRYMAKTDLQQILNFGDIQFFDEATIYVCIFITRKAAERSKEVLALSLNQKTYHGDFLNEIPRQLAAYPSAIFGESEWIIQPKAHFDILQKMQKGITLKDLPISIYRGILTGYNDAFFIDEAMRERLIAEDAKSAELIHPLLRGRDLQPWHTSNDGQYLINPHNGLPKKNVPPIDINDYPAIKAHLDQFMEKLVKRGDKGVTPYNLRSCEYLGEFSKPKIFYSEITAFFPFVYDDNGLMCNNKIFFITANDETVNLKYITAILNSKLCKLWIWYNCPELQGGTREIRKVYFEKFPLPADADQESLAALADVQIGLVSQLQEKRSRFLRRLSENLEGVKITTALQTFDQLDFAAFTKELKKQKIRLSLSQQDEWEPYFNDYAQACRHLSTQIAQTDAEINTQVFTLYALTAEEREIIS